MEVRERGKRKESKHTQAIKIMAPLFSYVKNIFQYKELKFFQELLGFFFKILSFFKNYEILEFFNILIF